MEMKLGSRGSPLALVQSRLVAAMLAKSAGADIAAFPIQSFMTSGDQIQGRLQEQGGKGLFTKELDEALLDGRIDCAVHSMKDLPTRMPHGIVLACVPSARGPARRDSSRYAPKRWQTCRKARRSAPPKHLRRQAQTCICAPT